MIVDGNLRLYEGENIYQRKGYANRQEYLDELAGEYGLDRSVVYAMADILGESEDFDGLLNILEDAEFVNVSDR
jgi:hypothetical protein